MDGGGRLARSMRSPGPQADLKAAAIGAAVLLRERLGFNRAGARQRPEREYHPHRLIALLERYIPHRAGVAATVLMLLGNWWRIPGLLHHRVVDDPPNHETMQANRGAIRHRPPCSQPFGAYF